MTENFYAPATYEMVAKELSSARQELEILNKENKRLCAQNAKQAAEIARLREALGIICMDGMCPVWIRNTAEAILKETADASTD